MAGVVAAVLVGCSGSDSSSSSVATEPAVDEAPVDEAPAGSVELVDPGALVDALDANPDLPLINVHIPYEGHIDGTDEFIAFDSILESSDLPDDRSAPIALYCRSGNMSAQAATALIDAGYTNVIDLDGGMNAWYAAGYQLLDDPTAAG